MKVRIIDNDEKVIWERGEGEGDASRNIQFQNLLIHCKGDDR